MASWTQRVVGAARLDVATYEEVEADKGATMQAMLVVVLSAIASGIGGVGRAGGRGFIGLAVGDLVGWLVWAFTTWLIGTKLLPEPETEADVGQLLRTTGFSASPGFLKAAGGFPLFGPLFAIAASLWMLVSMIVAVRQALDYKSTGRAVAVCVIGFVAYLAVFAGIALALGLGAKSLVSPGGAAGG